MWFKEIEDRLYSRIKAVLKAKYGTTYKDLNVTREKAVYEPTKLPTVALNFMIEERGQDLEATDINAVQMTIQVKVYVSSVQNLGVANDLTYEAMKILKEARFSVSMPEIETSSGDSIVQINSYRRLIGANDII